MKMTDLVAWREIGGHEIARHEIAGRENTGHEIARHEYGGQTTEK